MSKLHKDGAPKFSRSPKNIDRYSYNFSQVFVRNLTFQEETLSAAHDALNSFYTPQNYAFDMFI
jgi:hypothetical protein